MPLLAPFMRVFDACWSAYGDIMAPLLERDVGWMGGLLRYNAVKYIQVDYWVVGLTHRVLQLGVIVYIIMDITSAQSWAYAETPHAIVNAWGSPGDAASEYGSANYSDYSYCSNPEHRFKFDDAFVYPTPVCRFVVPQQLVTKGTSAVSITTMFLERRYTGWPCGGPGSAQEEAACTARSGTATTQASGQCMCESSITVYPVGVEKMSLSFEHTYQFPDGAYGLDKWKGTSTVQQDRVGNYKTIDHVLDTQLKFVDDSTITVEGGDSISLPVSTWLRMADASLEEENLIAGESADKPGVHPRYRMSGMILRLSIEYTNGQPSIQVDKDVRAEVTSTRQLTGWAGPGSEKIHIRYPSGAEGAQSFEYVDRYAQGIVFNFQAAGKVYVFDTFHFLNTLILGFVFLSVARSITDVVAFYLLPRGHSLMLSKHRYERVDRNSRWAEMGAKATLSALAYRGIDCDNNKVIEVDDIVRVLARACAGDADSPITCEKAHAMARSVLTDQHGQIDLNGLTFVEWMQTQDAGTMDFEVYIEKLPACDEADDEERARVYEAWEAGVCEALGTNAEVKKERKASREASKPRNPGALRRMGSGSTRHVFVAAPATKASGDPEDIMKV